jgi:protein-S-isoprenylcysteine O-methyltransferase Ste14
MQYLLLAVVWISWCALHSALISLRVTEVLRKRFPRAFRFYRLFYNLFAVATLVPVLLFSFSLRGEPLVQWHGLWVIVPVVLAAAALALFAAGARRYDFRRFLGLRQIKEEKSCSVLTDDCTLDTGGVMSVVRHPWYAGGILIVWARPLDLAAIVTNVILCGYFLVGAMLEERKLKVQFGRQYAVYQRRVSMLFPFKLLRRRLFGSS